MTVITGDHPAERPTGPTGVPGLRILTGGVTRLWLVALLVGCWEIIARIKQDAYFPPPSTIVRVFHELWFSGPATHLFLTDKALDDFQPSFVNLSCGWALAAVVGLALGVLLGRSRVAREILDPVLQFGRAIPPPTLIPFFIVVFDFGAQMQISTIAFGVIWPVLLNTADGVRTVEKLQLETAEVFGITGATRLLRITLPAAAPKIFAGLRVSLGFALVLMVISELIGSTTGIGAHLISSQQGMELPEMWAGIVLLGILGCLFNAVFALVERRFLSWHSNAHGLDS